CAAEGHRLVILARAARRAHVRRKGSGPARTTASDGRKDDTAFEPAAVLSVRSRHDAPDGGEDRAAFKPAAVREARRAHGRRGTAAGEPRRGRCGWIGHGLLNANFISTARRIT